MAFPSLWRTLLVGASFRGVPFHVERGGQAGGRRAAPFEIPKSDTGGYTEDMGRKLRLRPITGYVIGDNYIAERNALIAACETAGPGILIHPTLGPLSVICEDYQTEETRERGGICTIEMKFIESGQVPSAAVTDDTQSLVSAQADDAGTSISSVLDAALAAAFTAGATVMNIAEGVSILTTMLTALNGALSGQTGEAGSALFFDIQDLMENSESDIRSSALGAPLLAVFEAATTTGAALAGMTLVLNAMLAVSPSGAIGAAIATAGINMSLVEQSRILAATTFTSSNDVSAAIATNNANFEAAEETVADAGDIESYQALIALHGSVTRDLVARSLQLPSIVTYAIPRSIPALALAWRLYADSTRADELVAQNKVIHPLFMPSSGIALSD